MLAPEEAEVARWLEGLDLETLDYGDIAASDINVNLSGHCGAHPARSAARDNPTPPPRRLYLLPRPTGTGTRSTAVRRGVCLFCLFVCLFHP